jgi:uncharacterized membrane protein
MGFARCVVAFFAVAGFAFAFVAVVFFVAGFFAVVFAFAMIILLCVIAFSDQFIKSGLQSLCYLKW